MRVRCLPLALGAAVAFAVGISSCSSSSSSGSGGGGGGGGPTAPPPGKALLRFVHAVADARAFDFYADNSKVIPGLVFLKGTAYVVVDSNSATPIQVTPKDDTTAAHVLINTTVPITPDHTFTFYVVGPAASITTLFTADSNTAPRTTAIKLRFVNVAPSGGALDVYASAVGDTLPPTPLVGGLPFKTPSVYQLLAPGDWRIRVTAAGSRTVAVDDTLTGLNNGAVRTVVVMDNLGGGLPLHAINLPDAR